jgi:hypothetical protein
LGLGSIKTGSSGFVWGHTGVIYGYRSVAYYWPAKNVTIVISFNSVEDDPSLLLIQMLGKLSEYPESADRRWSLSLPMLLNYVPIDEDQ